MKMGYKMNTIMILGGAGFIGSHLADAYLRKGNNRVITVDDLSVTPDLKNLQFAKNHRNNRHEFYLADISDEKIMKKIKEMERPDIVINCVTNWKLYSFSLNYLFSKEQTYVIQHYDESVPPGTNSIITDRVFGGRQSYGLVRDVSFKLIRGNNDLNPNKDKIFEWTYIADLIKGIQIVVDNRIRGQTSLSSGWTATEEQVTCIMENIAGYKNRSPGLYENPRLDCSIVKTLGWQPTGDLKKALEATMAWYQLNGWAFRQDEQK